MRWLVYYLKEDLVPPDMVAGADVLDFSAGLGDLSEYMARWGARSVTATRPEQVPGEVIEGVDWVTGVAAGNVVDSLAGRDFDLIVARMVFQFPTWEGDRADPDTMLEEFAAVLRPGGRLVAAFHEFVPLEGHPATADVPEVDSVLEERPELAAVVRYLSLPPREGPIGQTGFGLKVPMFISSMVSKGFALEAASHPEPFTFPTEIAQLSDAEVDHLGDQVMALKERWLAHPLDPYEVPSLLRRMSVELAAIMPHVSWPIVRIVARRL